MSRPLISRSPDLERLRNEGFEISVRNGYLLLHHVPYLNSKRKVEYGILVSELTLSGDRTCAPGSHQTYLIGGVPCDRDGNHVVCSETLALT